MNAPKGNGRPFGPGQPFGRADGQSNHAHRLPKDTLAKCDQRRREQPLPVEQPQVAGGIAQALQPAFGQSGQMGIGENGRFFVHFRQ